MILKKGMGLFARNVNMKMSYLSRTWVKAPQLNYLQMKLKKVIKRG